MTKEELELEHAKVEHLIDTITKPLYKRINELENIINELENFITEKSNINNGAIQCPLSSNSEIKQMGIENNIYDLIIEKLYELKEIK